jgi:hypothetical protein
MNIKEKLELERKNFNEEIDTKTKKYQKIFGFEINLDSKYPTWNNESDAFKHAFMQAVLSVRNNDFVSKFVGDFHEFEGDLSKQPIDEKNMDLWNNAVGREIVKELKSEFGDIKKVFVPEHIEDMIAMKIVQYMKAGQLITTQKDTRKYDKKLFKKGIPAGYASTLGHYDDSDNDWEKYYFDEDLIVRTGEYNDLRKSFSGDAYARTGPEMRAAREAKIQSYYDKLSGKTQTLEDNDFDESFDLTGYENEVSGRDRIFTKEEIVRMSPQEYSKHEKSIKYQKEKIGIPTEKQAQSSASNGGMVYVNSYTRSDGTAVRSHYRSRPAY